MLAATTSNGRVLPTDLQLLLLSTLVFFLIVFYIQKNDVLKECIYVIKNKNFHGKIFCYFLLLKRLILNTVIREVSYDELH